MELLDRLAAWWKPRRAAFIAGGLRLKGLARAREPEDAGRPAAGPESLRLEDLPLRGEAAQRLEGWPEGCRAFFAEDPVRDPRLLVGREAHIEQFGVQVERWRRGAPAAVVLSGPPGSGKTSLLNAVQDRHLAGVTVTHIRPESRIDSELELLELLDASFEAGGHESLEDLMAAAARSGPRAVVFRDPHRLGARAMGSLEVIRAFAHFVAATGGQWFWVVETNAQTWRRLNYLAPLAPHFTRVLELPYLGREDLVSALLRREEALQVALRAEAQDEAAGEEAAAQRKQRWLEDLHGASGGNLHAALFLGALAARYDAARGCVTLGPCPKFDFSPLRELDRGQLFALAEVLVHGELSAEEHAAIFQWSPRESVLLLEPLCRSRLLETLPGPEPAYRVNRVLWEPVVSVLEKANILY